MELSLRCYAYAFDKSFDITKLVEFLKSRFELTHFEGALHVAVKIKYGDLEEGDIFLFPYGAMVTWGLEEDYENKLRREIKKCLAERLGAVDNDLFTYSYGEKSSIVDDHITLPDKDIYSKLSCSFALAQSVKLGGYENTIQSIFEKTKHLPERLAKLGKVNLSRRATRKLIGRIFVERTSINLHLDLMEAPNFFWENTELEPLHKMVTEYVDQRQRLNNLNQRLAVLQELLDMLATELNAQHSSRLEWIIIILIAIEIVLMLGNEILKFA